MPVRILIADDHGVLRAGLRALLNAEANLKVIGEAVNGEEAVRLACDLRPDVALVDITMPGMNGIEVTRTLKNKVPETRVLILTLHEDMGLLREAMRAGATGYIIKRAVDSELINAIHVVVKGEIYVHPTLAQVLLKNLAVPNANGDSNPTLSSREIEVLGLIAKGYTNRQIANQLNLSVRTVDTHRANVMGKLGLSNRADLVRYATEHGLLK